jgi:hypothetical protein
MHDFVFFFLFMGGDVCIRLLTSFSAHFRRGRGLFWEGQYWWWVGEVCSNGYGGGESVMLQVLGVFQILVFYSQFHYVVLCIT